MNHCEKIRQTKDVFSLIFFADTIKIAEFDVFIV